MYPLGQKLKVLDGEHADKIGIVVEAREKGFQDRNLVYHQPYQILQFEDGTKAKFPIYQIGILENINFRL